MKILLVQTGFLGDIVLSTAVISAVREHYPGSSLHFLTTPQGKRLVEQHPQVERVLTFDKRKSQRGLGGLLSLARELRREKYDVAFSLHKSFRTALLLLFSRIPLRYGFREASLWWTYTKTARRKDLPHEVLRNLAILRTVGVAPESVARPLEMFVSDAAQNRARELLSQGARWVGVAPGSVWATKRWTPEGFARVIETLAKEGRRLVLIGGAEDEAVAQEILRELPTEVADEVLNLLGKTDLETSAAVIAQLDLLLTNDSAPLHLASAMQTPVLAIFCATVPEFGYGPWRVHADVVGVNGLACRPCGRHGGATCPTGTHACQRGLLPEVVLERIRGLLEKEQRSGSLRE